MSDDPTRDTMNAPDDSNGVLADPRHASTPELIHALETLDEDAARRWLEDHPDARQQIEGDFREVFEAIQTSLSPLLEEFHDALKGLCEGVEDES